MSNQNAASSDLAKAQELSHRLRGEGGNTPAPRPVSAGAYVRLRPQVPSIKPVPEIPPGSGLGEGTWGILLTWCLEVTKSEAAFVMEDQGLVVASQGNLPAEQLDHAGARLVIAMEQTAAMDALGPIGGVMTIAIAEKWLTALRIPLDAGANLILAVIGDTPPPEFVRKVLVRSIATTVLGL